MGDDADALDSPFAEVPVMAPSRCGPTLMEGVPCGEPDASPSPIIGTDGGNRAMDLAAASPDAGGPLPGSMEPAEWVSRSASRQPATSKWGIADSNTIIPKVLSASRSQGHPSK